jgi:addiction module HigA family antidote
MKRLKHIHPGRILFEEFLEPMRITKYRLAKEIHETQTKIGQIVRCTRSITPETGLKLDRFFGFKTEGFFYGLQVDYDLAEAKSHLGKELLAIKIFKADESAYC